MEAAVQELLHDFFQETSVRPEENDIDAPLKRLVEDVESGSSVLKRDLQRLLEKDPGAFLQSACRILKVSARSAGAAPLLDLLWSNPLLLTSLIDPSTMSLPTATALAKRWVVFDPMLDIKLLQIGFPLGEDDEFCVVDVNLVRPKRALDIVTELPPNRHALLALAKLLRSPEPYIRSKAALLYARASKNPDWVRKMLGEPDARVRANAVEGLWEVRSPFAVAVFKEAALDPNHRVAANALIGLHYSGAVDEAVTDRLQSMTQSADSLARAAAAFVLGHIMDANSTPVLETLLRDHNQDVRGQALHALLRIRRRDRPEDASVAETVPAPSAGALEHPAPQKPLPADLNR